jgi:targeting protein for Xklp2
MEATAEESVSTLVTTMVDETYEFLAPRWFDFVNGETEDESRRAELWFQSALSCAPSPSVPRIKARRSFKVEAMCNFNEAEEETLKDKEPLEPVVPIVSLQSQPSQAKKAEVAPSKASTVKPSRISSKDAEVNNKTVDASDPTTEPIEDKENIAPACTPKPPMQFSLGAKSVDLKKQQTARKIASLLKNPSTLRPKNQSQAKGSHQKSVKGETNLNNIASTTNLIQENQAIKRQKLDDGKSRQILNPKPATLLHKTRNGLVNTGFNLCPSVTKHTPKENRKVCCASWLLVYFFCQTLSNLVFTFQVYVREQIAPFVSTAELMKKFQTSTRDLFVQNRPKLTLTRPKEPEFVTSQRARPLRVKSSAELEEEMLAKIPKFKARPVNKKILAAPALPAPQRSTPHLPEFQEFHLQTMARANQHAETSSIASTEVSKQVWSFFSLPEKLYVYIN